MLGELTTANVYRWQSSYPRLPLPLP